MFSNKKELVQFVKEQLNVNLENDKDNKLNRKRNILYTQIAGTRYSNEVLRLLNQKEIRYEHHIHDNYWVWVK